MMSIVNSFLKTLTCLRKDPIHYFRGPSGIGKSYALIHWILENRKQDDVRILHMILDCNYLDSPSNYFAYDFIYCFYKDLEIADFPKPHNVGAFKYNEKISNGENWFEFLCNTNQNNTEFLQEIIQYLKTKKIAFIIKILQ